MRDTQRNEVPWRGRSPADRVDREIFHDLKRLNEYEACAYKSVDEKYEAVKKLSILDIESDAQLAGTLEMFFDDYTEKDELEILEELDVLEKKVKILQ